MTQRMCPCGNEAASPRGIPRCADCVKEHRRAYHREQKRQEYQAYRVSRGLPLMGDQVTSLCRWCETEFTYVYRSQKRNRCDQCRKISHANRTKRWAREHPEWMQAYQKAWSEENPERRAEYRRRYKDSDKGQATVLSYNQNVGRFRKYGITPEQFEEMLAHQGGRCAICSATEPGGRHGTWHIDHDRRCCPKSGSCGQCVRGVLCQGCNMALGQAQDDPLILRAAADYLEAHRLITKECHG